MLTRWLHSDWGNATYCAFVVVSVAVEPGAEVAVSGSLAQVCRTGLSEIHRSLVTLVRAMSAHEEA